MNRLRFACFLGLGALLFGLLGSAAPARGQAEGDAGVIKIVSSLPRSGASKHQTDTIVNGIQMALDEVQHKVGDFTIQYEDKNDATASSGDADPALEANIAKAAAADPDVMVYIGPFNSTVATNSMPILNRVSLLMISPANTAVGLTKKNYADPDEPDKYRPTGKINYVRVVPTDDLQGPLAADWAKEMGLKRVVVLDDQTVYGQGIARLFADRCADIGLTVVDGPESIDAKNSPSFGPLMRKLKDKNPDLIYFGGTTQNKAGQLVKDMLDAGLENTKFMVPDGCMEQSFIDSAGAKNLENRCYATFGGLTSDTFKTTDQKFLEEHKSQKEFVDQYKKKFGADPEPYAVYGYESAKVALEAIRRAGKKDRAAIVAACLGIKDFHGALGTWSFDENGDTTRKQLCGYVVKDGQFQFMKSLGQ